MTRLTSVLAATRQHRFLLAAIAALLVMGLVALFLGGRASTTDSLPPAPVVVVDGSLGPPATADVLPLNDRRNVFAQYVNVIYYVGKGQQPHPEYRQRITGILNNVKAFYQEEIESYGYSNSTVPFHYEPNGLVSITFVEGSKPLHEQEKILHDPQVDVIKYFRENPQEDRGDVQLLITGCTSHEGTKFCGGGGVTLGVWAYAQDDPGRSVENVGVDGETTRMVGTLAHELGHAMGLPHDSFALGARSGVKKSSLMDAGNYHYGQEMMGLSHSGAAILGRSRLFSPKEQWTNQLPQAKLNWARYRSDPTGTTVRVEGSISSLKDGQKLPESIVEHVLVRVDPPGRTDYNSVTYMVQQSADDTFAFNVKLDDLPGDGAGANAAVVGGEVKISLGLVFTDMGAVGGGMFPETFTIAGGVTSMDKSYTAPQ